MQQTPHITSFRLAKPNTQHTIAREATRPDQDRPGPSCSVLSCADSVLIDWHPVCVCVQPHRRRSRVMAHRIHWDCPGCPADSCRQRIAHLSHTSNTVEVSASASVSECTHRMCQIIYACEYILWCVVHYLCILSFITCTHCYGGRCKWNSSWHFSYYKAYIFSISHSSL